MNTIQLIDREGSSHICNSDFSQRVRVRSKANLDRCYQCLTCSLGCPVVFAMDYPPHQIIRMVQLGLKEATLNSSTIWICAACETCVTRCPNEVDIVGVMDTLRQMSLEEKIKGKEVIVPVFHDTFLNTVRQFGRQYELGMLLQLKLRTKDPFSDLGLGLKMLRRRKLKLSPPESKSKKEVREIFNRVKAIREGQS